MYKFFDLLLNFRSNKQDMMAKGFIWGIGLFLLCFLISLSL